MKIFKIALLTYFLFHFSLVVLVNLMALTIMKNSNEEFNSIGNAIVQMIEKPPILNNLDSSIGLYVNMTGVDRGYEFFSPNIFGGSIDISFESDDGKQLHLFKSLESRMKFITFCLYLNSNLQDTKKRHEILKSVSRRFFSKQTDLNEVHIYARIEHYERLDIATQECYKDQTEKVLLSKIKKPCHEKYNI